MEEKKGSSVLVILRGIAVGLIYALWWGSYSRLVFVFFPPLVIRILIEFLSVAATIVICTAILIWRGPDRWGTSLFISFLVFVLLLVILPHIPGAYFFLYGSTAFSPADRLYNRGIYSLVIVEIAFTSIGVEGVRLARIVKSWM